MEQGKPLPTRMTNTLLYRRGVFVPALVIYKKGKTMLRRIAHFMNRFSYAKKLTLVGSIGFLLIVIMVGQLYWQLSSEVEFAKR